MNRRQARQTILNLSRTRFDLKTWDISTVAGIELARLTPSRLTDAGLPVYSFDRIERLTQMPASEWQERRTHGTEGIEPTNDGGVLTIYNGGPAGGKNPWDKAAWNRLVKFGPRGDLQWQVGQHMQTAQYPKGDMVFIKPSFDKAIFFRPKVAAGAAKKPFTFTSPVSQFSMDYVALAKGGQVVFKPRADGKGYIAEAQIPLSELPDLSAQGGNIGFDAGLIFSDAGGNDRNLRVYWNQSDNNTHFTIDIPIEAQLYPKLWGTATVEETP